MLVTLELSRALVPFFLALCSVRSMADTKAIYRIISRASANLASSNPPPSAPSSPSPPTPPGSEVLSSLVVSGYRAFMGLRCSCRT
uniref:Uncharacterized protein n=1 Tax=Human herpesvirus 2 TaxID=10310 RepID=A0A481TFS3_HHV2|nr:hypothetical protein [Human alphaherpesvirus 2]